MSRPLLLLVVLLVVVVGGAIALAGRDTATPPTRIEKAVALENLS